MLTFIGQKTCKEVYNYENLPDNFLTMANLTLLTRYIEDKRRFQELDTKAERINANQDLQPGKDGYWCTVNRDMLSFWIKDNSAKIETESHTVVVAGNEGEKASFYLSPIESDKMLILLR